MKTQTKVLGALWLFQVVNYLDRVVISFAGPMIMKSLAIGPSSFGIVLSSFALGYFLAQLPGGLIADRWGTRPLLVIAPLFWALFTGATGLVATVVGFVIVRLCFGLSEGLSNAAIWKALGDNFSAEERPRAVGLFSTALPFAPAFTGPLMAFLMVRLSWQSLFMLLALPAVIAALVNYLALPRRDDARRAMSQSLQIQDAKGGTFAAVMRKPSLWIVAFAYCCYSVALWGFVGWMPSYLALGRGINLKSVGMLGSIPYAFGLVGLILVGSLGSSIFRRFLPQLTIVSYLLSGLGFYIAYSATTLTGSLVGLSITAAFLYGALSSFGSIVLELAPAQSRASYSGVVNASGQLGGLLAPLAIGYLVSASGTFLTGFALMVGSLIFAAICILVLIPSFSARPVPEATAVPSPS